MEGEAAAIRAADELDPLALTLTLGSIYAAAAAVAATPASPPAPPPPPPPAVAPRATQRRRLNNGSAPIHSAAAAPASPPAPAPPPPPPPAVAPRGTQRRLNNRSAPIHSAAAAPASRPLVAPLAACRRLDNGSAPVQAAAAAPAAPRRRANRAVRRRPRADAAGDLVEAPFPWATERPAQHGTLESLLRRGVTSVEGQARCKRCGARKAVAYDLEAKFWEVRDYIVTNRHDMYDRAPKAWEFPALPDCDACGHKGAMWPEIAADKHDINWLFLFLGQMLGCCTLEQLRYFCMNSGRHRTGAKNRVLYHAYIEMSNQLLSFD